MTDPTLTKVYRLGAVSSVEASFFDADDNAKTDRFYLTRAEWEALEAPVGVEVVVRVYAT